MQYKHIYLNREALNDMNGIDVYEGNDLEDFSALKTQGVEVIIAKATQGADYTDHSFAYRCNHVRQAGIKFGAYHFAGGLHPAEQEAEHFLDVIKGQTLDTVVFLDIENYSSKIWTKQEAIDFCNAWFNYVKVRGYKIGLYTNESLYLDYLKGNIPQDVVLWIANYGRKPEASCSWQYSENGRLNGASGDLDLDNFQNDIFITPGTNIASGFAAPQVEGDPEIKRQQTLLNMFFKCGLLVDGVPGTNTKKWIRNFEQAMGLSVDSGVWGQHCEAAAGQIFSRPLDWRNALHLEYATRYIQYRVGSGRDKPGYFSSGTASCLGNWQSSHGLVPDQKCGTRSWGKFLDENV